jgi:carbon-monoxide dehydrogenase large subunit
VKGCGEAGAIALFPAVVNAITDAVGVAALDGPASAFRVWQAMRQIVAQTTPHFSDPASGPP